MAPKIVATDGQDTDQAIWRATHGVLLAIARAGDRLIAAGDRGTILLSDNDGQTWKQVPSGTQALLMSLVFTSPQEGWVVGQDGTILHTTDRGDHWASQHAAPGGDQALFSVAAAGPHHLVATGAYALALETTDGAVWTAIKLPAMDEDYHLNCVIAHDDDVLATGEGGHAFWRHDGTWQAVPVPYDGSQFGCLPAAAGGLYSFGLRGSLFTGVPGAKPWTRLDSGTTQSLFGGATLAAGGLALVGGNGLVALYDPVSNKGRLLPSPTGSTLSGVVEGRDGRLIVVGDDGVHTIDPKAPEMTQ